MDKVTKASYLTVLEEICWSFWKLPLCDQFKSNETEIHWSHTSLTTIVNAKATQINNNVLALTVQAHPMVSQEATINHQNVLHGEKSCVNCNIPNHFDRVCQKEKWTSAGANTLNAHVHYDQLKNTYTNFNNHHSNEILSDLKPVVKN